MPNSRCRALVLGWVCLSAAVAGRASAGDSPPTADQAQSAPDSGPFEPAPGSEALIQQGIELRKRGDDRGALDAFERARKLDDSAHALAQLALAEQALGRWREAHLHLEEALARAADPWIATHRATLEEALREIGSRLGALEISCNVAGAEVQVDGHVLAHTPLEGPLRLVAGESVIRLSARGYFDVTRRVTVDAGGLARLEVTLTSSSASGADEAPKVPLQTSSVQAARLPVATAVPQPMASEHLSSRDILTYTSLGLAGLGLTVGVTGYVMREVAVNAYNDDARCDTQPTVVRSEECKEDWKTGEALFIAGLSATGAFGVTALILWLGRPTKAGEARVACNVGALSIGCRGQF